MIRTKGCVALVAVLVLASTQSGCTRQESPNAAPSNVNSLTGDYLGQVPPGDEPTLFEPAVIPEGLSVRDMAISPDGNEIFYTLRSIGATFSAIVSVSRTDNAWSEPRVASFSGKYSDIEPAFSIDGRRLFFSSRRTLDGVGEPKDWDIWFVDRQADGWSEPTNLGPPVNTGDDEYYPSVSSSGTLYFTAERDGGEGAEDIWYSVPNGDGSFGEVNNVGPGVNTDKYEFNAFVSADEDYILFTSFRRDDDLGNGDLYVSYRSAESGWLPATHFDPPINSPRIDYNPFVSPDGKFMFFTSERSDIRDHYLDGVNYRGLVEMLRASKNGLGDVYWVSTDTLLRR